MHQNKTKRAKSNSALPLRQSPVITRKRAKESNPIQPPSTNQTNHSSKQKEDSSSSNSFLYEDITQTVSQLPPLNLSTPSGSDEPRDSNTVRIRNKHDQNTPVNNGAPSNLPVWHPQQNHRRHT